jgi:hypothetical protein
MYCAIYLEERVVEVEYLSAHEVLSANSTEDDNVTPDTLISENTNTAASVKTSESLGHLIARLACTHNDMFDVTYLVVKASLPDHVDEDVVCLSGDLNSLFGNIAKNSDGNSWAAFDSVSYTSSMVRKTRNVRVISIPREWMSANQRLVDAELTTDCLQSLVKVKSKFIPFISLPSLHLSVTYC